MKRRKWELKWVFGISLSLLSAGTALGATLSSPFAFECLEVRDARDASDSAGTRAGAGTTWCYVDQKAPHGSTRLVFDATDARLRSELAALVERDERGETIAITHGVLNGGRREIVRAEGAALNPLPVPLDLPESRELGAQAAPRRVDPAFAFDRRVQTLFATLQEPGKTVQAADQAVRAGKYEEMITEDKLPWRGYWWPFRGVPIARDINSPLAKYDRILEARDGVNPGAAQWELVNHSLEREAWGGHCNGWAAASILYPEPRTPIRDERTGIELSIHDQKAILIESSWCTERAFYGVRYRGRGGDKKDIYPHEFHKVITYYLRDLKKPIAMDYHDDEMVDNNVATGYKMEIKQKGRGEFEVKVKLRMHNYDDRPSNDVGVARTYEREYKYKLFLDAHGEPVDGKWLSGNPDFIWVPIAQRDCEDENANLHFERVHELLRTSVRQ